MAALAAFDFERKNIVATANAMHRELSAGERERLAELFSDKIDAFLDAGRGRAYLKSPDVARATRDTLLHFDGARYQLSAWCLMPNHVHVVFRPLQGYALASIVHTWKSYSAHEANRILKRSGSFWQREYYDHLVRNEEDFLRIVRYVIENPKKANLASWPWVGVGA